MLYRRYIKGHTFHKHAVESAPNSLLQNKGSAIAWLWNRISTSIPLSSWSKQFDGVSAWEWGRCLRSFSTVYLSESLVYSPKFWRDQNNFNIWTAPMKAMMKAKKAERSLARKYYNIEDWVFIEICEHIERDGVWRRSKSSSLFKYTIKIWWIAVCSNHAVRR